MSISISSPLLTFPNFSIITSVYSSLLVIIIGVLIEYPSFSSISMSNSNNISPLLTFSPCDFFFSKPLPSNLTVSAPICINISEPSILCIPIACPVEKMM